MRWAGRDLTRKADYFGPPARDERLALVLLMMAPQKMVDFARDLDADRLPDTLHAVENAAKRTQGWAKMMKAAQARFVIAAHVAVGEA